MPEANATLPGMLLVFKDYLPESATAGDRVYSTLFLLMFIAMLLRYFIIASGVFWIVWKVFKQRNAPFKLDPRPLDIAQIRREIGWSMCSLVLFSCVAVSIAWLRRAGFTKVYESISEHGTPYFVSSIFIMLMVHDLYFYVIHRAMHTQLLQLYLHDLTSSRYRTFHKVHHLSIDPTPFASFSFHPLEAALEAGIAFLCVFTMPIHPVALFLFQMASFSINVYGHLGYEFSQHRTKSYAVWHPLRYINHTSQHHDHHKRGSGCKSGNFGLYTTVWDHLFSTLLPAAPHGKPRDESNSVGGSPPLSPLRKRE